LSDLELLPNCPPAFLSVPTLPFRNSGGSIHSAGRSPAQSTYRQVGFDVLVRPSQLSPNEKPPFDPLFQDFRAKRDKRFINLTACIASFVRVPCL
jgi:hypothetical protein